MRWEANPIDYADWEKTVPERITNDPLWRVEAYRLALFAADLRWHDVTKLMRSRRTLQRGQYLREEAVDYGA